MKWYGFTGQEVGGPEQRGAAERSRFFGRDGEETLLGIGTTVGMAASILPRIGKMR
jgi:hypothetical protein